MQESETVFPSTFMTKWIIPFQPRFPRRRINKGVLSFRLHFSHQLAFEFPHQQERYPHLQPDRIRKNSGIHNGRVTSQGGLFRVCGTLKQLYKYHFHLDKMSTRSDPLLTRPFHWLPLNSLVCNLNDRSGWGWGEVGSGVGSNFFIFANFNGQFPGRNFIYAGI